MLDLPRDADVLMDLLSFEVIKGIPKLPDSRNVQRASPGSRVKAKKRHGDAAIAIALAHYASRKPMPAYEGYQSVKKRTETRLGAMRGGAFGRRTGGML
jgi:phage FluMu gp28-like protein